MSETAPPALAASTAPVKPSAGKKTKKPAKAVAPAKKNAGPSVSELIVQAVSSSKERGGVSLAALKKALAAAGYDVEKNNGRIKLGLKSLVNKGTLVQTKGTGASGSFKLNKKASVEAKPSASKVAVKAKAVAASKKPRKAAGATAMKNVKTPKKAKKPAVTKASKSPKKSKAVKPKKGKSPGKAVKPKAAKVRMTKPKTAAKPKKATAKKK
ncbi:histone H1.1 [Otolemur garnettii]|uniref:histone H1.1 n=1 Tax=Otolemur garnettii TaxID=30611 RepID=UPI000151252E|nr:histone H1.1 [Otolemur garnettii]